MDLVKGEWFDLYSANERKIGLKQQEVPLCVKKHTAVFFVYGLLVHVG